MGNLRRSEKAKNNLIRPIYVPARGFSDTTFAANENPL
jgi:hypothetical protein